MAEHMAQRNKHKQQPRAELKVTDLSNEPFSLRTDPAMETFGVAMDPFNGSFEVTARTAEGSPINTAIAVGVNFMVGLVFGGGVMGATAWVGLAPAVCGISGGVALVVALVVGGLALRRARRK
ncbi:hypothetical protein [Kitasatospora sp. NPDC006786]|uniref:hypothetical protein n=1 Tax=unclassified Kitasatospora TaxID=2633591 RepID=UPI0033C06E36